MTFYMGSWTTTDPELVSFEHSRPQYPTASNAPLGSPMRILDAKSGAEATLPEYLHDFTGALLRALLSYVTELAKSTCFGLPVRRKSAILASGLVEGEQYADWDEERFAAVMTRVINAALIELRSWQYPSPPRSILGGFEAEIIQHETLYPPISQPSRIPMACPQVLHILHLRGLWHFMTSGDSFWSYFEAQEVLFVLKRTSPLIPDVWKPVAEDLIRVCKLLRE